MNDDGLRLPRVVSVVAATCIALSCGTNYAYSAWAPQYAERLHLTATQINIIGNAGNIGMYASGIPVGLVVDRKGPRWAVSFGALCLACGYFPLWSAYEKGPGQTAFFLICLASLLTGVGSSAAFSGAIKVAATNWPHHRGTATALPLSGFGLSAFAYTGISAFAFENDADHLLLLLAIGTSTMVFVGMLFLRSLPPGAVYLGLSDDEAAPHNSNRLHRTDSRTKKTVTHGFQDDQGAGSPDVSEDSSLLSGPGDMGDDAESASAKSQHLHKPDVTGVALLRRGSFWKLFVLLGLLCGVGLMTINNIGNDAKTLWHHWDGKASKSFIQQRQLMHVGILSVCSFLGRLSSGIGSDVLVRSFHSSRFWSIVAAASAFTIAQILALNIENPNWLFLLSGSTGLAYGTLFGVLPAIVADSFGAGGLGVNWGILCLSPVISGNIFNLIYGANLDAHSNHPEGEERVCIDGRVCYSGAYIVTLIASGIAVAWSLWCVRHEQQQKRSRERGRENHVA